ncbi:MAG: beta,3-galactosyltransferase [Candidatus Nomurabacteria bacterium]|nr:beta,3-galactosyltransferase [Candidatus Nomurabacteria bacterium]
MRISVCIIAHNEEKYIKKCIESLLNQTKKADEIVIVLHNTTDKSGDLIKPYPVKVVNYSGPKGIIFARMEALRHTTGDVILCIDGDSYANINWIEEMTRTLLDGNILVGSWIKFKGNFFDKALSQLNKIFCNKKGKEAAGWLWGGSMAFNKADKEPVEKVWNESVEWSLLANLTRNPEDYWLALCMLKIGELQVTNKTHTTHYSKSTSSLQAIKRHIENIRNGKKMQKFFESKSLRV